MAVQRAIVLSERYQSIITKTDSYAYLRPMTQLLECRCRKGRLLLVFLDLQNLNEYPEARALQASTHRYLGSKDFNTCQRIDPEVIKESAGSLVGGFGRFLCICGNSVVAGVHGLVGWSFQ